MRKKLITMCFFWLILLLPVNMFSTEGITEVFIKIIEEGKRLDIGIANFVSLSETDEERALANKLQNILKDDLIFSRYFNVIVPDIFFTADNENRKRWERYKVEAIATANIKLYEDKRLLLSGEVIDFNANKTIFKKSFVVDSKDYRSATHMFADEIVLRFTGEKGIANSKIIFSNDATGFKELYIIDYDGYNLKRITNDKSLNVFPKFSSDGTKVYFLTYKKIRPQVSAISLRDYKVETILSRRGINYLSSVKDENIFLTIVEKGDPEVYMIRTSGEIVRRLTFSRGVDTSASVSPTGRQITFVSDRSGIPQIYIMDIDGVTVRKIETNKYSTSPMWSPRGDKIVFTMREKGVVDIYLYDILTGGILRLTRNAGNNESPAFSPDGRFIVFTSTRNKERGNELFMCFIDGSGQIRVANIPGNSYTPSWH